MKGANLAEVFSGVQGEGLLLGASQIFIRFAGCNLRCKYCDTRYALEVPEKCRWKVEGARWEETNNPIPVDQLIEAIKRFGTHYHSISLTGGEPLLQGNFIEELLDLLPAPYSHIPIYLETNATLPGELNKSVDRLDIIAMDIKLPSTTGQGEFWEEHKEFLAIAKKSKVFAKVVINQGTKPKDVEMAVSLIKKTDNRIPFILQPDANSPPSREQLFDYQRMANISLNEVRIIPQIHKLMGWK